MIIQDEGLPTNVPATSKDLRHKKAIQLILKFTDVK